jgi:hypothetical protein
MKYNQVAVIQTHLQQVIQRWRKRNRGIFVNSHFHNQCNHELELMKHMISKGIHNSVMPDGIIVLQLIVFKAFVIAPWRVWAAAGVAASAAGAPR